MAEAAEAAVAFLRALERLPPYTGVVFRGLPSIPALSSVRWTRGVTATSRDPRIATENFSAASIAAIVSRTGRDISSFSRYPDEREVVLPPEVALVEIARTTTDDGRAVILIEQLSEPAPSDLPSTLSELTTLVKDELRRAQAMDPVRITTVEKFVEPLYLVES
jgi:hypothetical protein